MFVFQQIATSTAGNRKAMSEPPVGMLSISQELDSLIYDHRKAKGGRSLVRASSSNIMLAGDLGNVRITTRTYCERQTTGCGSSSNAESQVAAEAPSLCTALSTRLDPEELKEMGNEEYKNGRYAEALEFYDQAIIALEPRSAAAAAAAYRDSKAAALARLGKLLDAVGECREAFRIDPTCNRIHRRLASLYLRLGEVDKALQHYRRLGNETSPGEVSKAQALRAHLGKSKEARTRKDWQTALQEADAAISSGADSAPQVFAAQAEALMKLHRHDDAHSALIDAPIYDIDESTKFFGTAWSAYILLIRAQITMAAGKFDDAISVVHKASQIDPGNKEIATTARSMRAMASARSKGNELFKTGRYSEACRVYGGGLDLDSHNSILRCNRATCWAKLEQYEKAIEDCNLALSVRPSYSKARLRRADCYVKLENWNKALSDYEVLIEEMPEDEEVKKAFTRAQIQIRRQKSEEGIEETRIMTLTTTATTQDVIVIKAPEKLSDFIHCKDTSAILFCDKSHETEQMMPFLGQLCRKYASVNFLKVDKEDLMKFEGVDSQPAFRIYQNGSLVRHIDGCDWDIVERSVKKLNT